ncbi:unnamed protein product [Sphagnum jensenii]|uniref:SLH domain-containing protein n=1 Tax=Sphagnum jensenii TaxID=128206 RepID=A0ABP0WI72_9BRYO
MAFGMKSLPTSLCLTHKPLYLGLYHSPSIRLAGFHSNVGAPPMQCPSVQCNAKKEDSDTLLQEEKPHHKEVVTNPSWSSNPDTPAPAPSPTPPEGFAGWPPADSDPQGSWKVGLLQVGAGFVLALGFSVAAFAAYSRYGNSNIHILASRCSCVEKGAKRQLDLGPFTTQQQQASIAGESESVDASSNKGTIQESLEEESKQDLQEEQVSESAVEAASQPEIKPVEDQILDSNEKIPALSSDASGKPEVDTSVPEDLQRDMNEEANSGSVSLADESKYDAKSKSTKDDQTFSGTALPQSAPVYITAPLSAAAASAQSRPGKVVVPAVVDQMQQHALEALQALKVMDPEILAGDICTRREYARWLIASSSRLTRSTAHKVFPAMYIENVTQHAFDDVSAEDPDFAFIQGLAEAGLISSNLSKTGVEDNGTNTGVLFEPDSPLSRQDLVSWKVALDRRELLSVNKEGLQKASGFVDVDQIHEDAWPALMADLTAEEPSIIASAFGFTRRFQPEKPTTKGQAAVALASGEAAENVSEELARLEAEALADKAVAADIAMEVRAQRDINGQFSEELQAEKAKREQAEKLIEEVRAELQKAKTERDEERYAVMKDRATLDSEKELLTVLRQQVDEQLQAFSGLRVEVAVEKERLEKLRVEREEELKEISNYKRELEVERRALTLVRSWAEDEAKQAQAQGQALEEARKRWENQGLEVDTTQDKDDNPEQTKDIRMELENLFQQVTQQPQQEDAVGEDFKSQVNYSIIRSWQATTGVFSGLFHKVASFLKELGMKVQQLQQNVISSAGERAQHIQEAVAAMSTSVVEGSKRLADNCKGEAEKFAHRFKHE